MNRLRRTRRSILGVEDARKILNPFMDELIASANDGMNHFGTFSPEHLLPFRKRTKACMLNDAIVTAATHRFENAKGIALNDDYETKFFIFDGRLALRYKKMDCGDTPKNIRTDRQDDVAFHVLELAGIETLTFVTFGYWLNPLWNEIVRMKLLCKWGCTTEWSIPLIEGAQPQLFDLEQRRAAEASSDDGPAVRSTLPKQSGQRAGEDA